ncbi:MAG: hypothetical protein IAI50_11680 [Candidatus Eremiobacteraeota bacterium]|nr:hypothetical protein [Candidatus Eremiobacteraeota bacterium]
MTEPSLDSESDALQERLSFADRVALALPEADLRHRVAAFDIYDTAEDEPRPDVAPPPPAEHVPLVVHSQRPAYERAVPITRLPLRSQTNEITWSALADPSRLDVTRSDRHALLAALPTGTAGTSAELLMLAYNEEDAAGRLLAMRALMRVDAGRGRQVFIEALRAGTDEERAFAIDALVASGAREALIPAFSDRVEAVAAKAALAFVGTNVRDDYQHALRPYIDEARIEALLALLAGYLI